MFEKMILWAARQGSAGRYRLALQWEFPTWSSDSRIVRFPGARRNQFVTKSSRRISYFRVFRNPSRESMPSAEVTSYKSGDKRRSSAQPRPRTDW